MMWKLPHYDPPFDLGEAYHYGYLMNKRIERRVPVGSTPEDAGILAQAIYNAGNTDYLELGTLYGGSAILASLVKQHFELKGRVVCVDDLEMLGRTQEELYNNAAQFGAKIELQVGKTYPLPVTGRFGCVYVDAAHDYESCRRDGESVKSVANRYVVFHDYDFSHRGVMQAVRGMDIPIVHISQHTAVLEFRP